MWINAPISYHYHTNQRHSPFAPLCRSGWLKNSKAFTIFNPKSFMEFLVSQGLWFWYDKQTDTYLRSLVRYWVEQLKRILLFSVWKFKVLHLNKFFTNTDLSFILRTIEFLRQKVRKFPIYSLQNKSKFTFPFSFSIVISWLFVMWMWWDIRANVGWCWQNLDHHHQIAL